MPHLGGTLETIPYSNLQIYRMQLCVAIVFEPSVLVLQGIK